MTELPTSPKMRAMAVRHLAEAEKHAALAQEHVIRQMEILAELERDGYEQAAHTARELLATFQDTLQSHLEDRDRLRAEVAALD